MAVRLNEESLVAQNPLIIRLHRLMEAFAKSNDERDFYLDRLEGFLVYADLDKSEEELNELHAEIKRNNKRYVAIPKLTFYEIKKVMEGFVNEKVYDIDTKEKLLDIIQSKEARENFLEFIYDHHNEMEKWQQFYQERFRIRIIEWLRQHHFDFVFEEDLDLTKSIVEKVRISMFDPKANKEVVQARKLMVAKAKTYYSNEALNPRPKRGRPPKQVVKVETEPQFSTDVFIAVPKGIKSFLFTPDYRSSAAVYVFSGKFTSEAELLAHRRQQLQTTSSFDSQSLTQKLSVLRSIAAPFHTEENDSYGMEGYRDVVQQVEAGRQAAKKAVESNKNGFDKKLDSPKISKSTASKPEAKKISKKEEPVVKKGASKNSVVSKANLAKTSVGKGIAPKGIPSKSNSGKFVAPSKSKVAVKKPVVATKPQAKKQVVAKSTTASVKKPLPSQFTTSKSAPAKLAPKKAFGKPVPVKTVPKKGPIKSAQVVKKAPVVSSKAQPKARLRPLPPKKVKRK